MSLKKSYNKLLQFIPLVFNDPLIIIWQIPLLDNEFQMNIQKVYNIPILHLRLLKFLIHIRQLSCNIFKWRLYYTSTEGVTVCILTMGHMRSIKLCTQQHKSKWYIYDMFRNVTQRIKKDCQYDIKPQSHNLAHSLKSSLWAISALTTKDL